MPAPLQRPSQCPSPARCQARFPAAAALALLLAAPAGARPAGDRQRLWGDGQRLELLPLQQDSLEVLARSRVTLLIRPHDLPRPYEVLRLVPPATLDAGALARHLRLCRIEPPVASLRPRCLEVLPLRRQVEGRGLRLQLQRPLEPASAHALELLLRNPLQQGFHPLRLYGLRPERPEPDYLGTWLLETFAQPD